MTVKLNLNPLISKFQKKNPTVASRLHGLTTNAKTTKANQITRFQKIAEVLTNIADEFDQIDPTIASEADQLLEELVREAQQGTFNLDSSMFQEFAGEKLMDKVGDEDEAECGSCGVMESGHKCMGPSLEMAPEAPEEASVVLVIEDVQDQGHHNHSGHAMMEDVEAEEEEEEEVLQSDPEIEEIKEQDEEYDYLSLDDFDDLLNNANRFSISRRREIPIYESAKLMAQKSKDYYEAHKKYLAKAHEEFDGAGLKFRLKDFE